MTKAEFIDKLCEGLRHNPDAQEVQRTVMFYSEAIDDRMEDGMTEEEAVAAMGSVDDIIWELRSSWNQQARDSAAAQDAVEPGDIHRTFDPAAVSRIDIFDTSGDVDIGPSPDGQIHVEYTATQEWRYDITEGDTLTVRRVRNSQDSRVDINLFGAKLSFTKPGFWARGFIEMRLKLLLPDGCDLGVKITAASGDVECANVRFGSLSIALGSGDVDLKNLVLTGRAGVTTVSGDVRLTRVDAGEIKITTVSGDADLTKLSSSEADISSTSGDLTIEDLRTGSLQLSSASGDMDLDYITVSSLLAVHSISGDIDGTLSAVCQKISAETVSGDMCLTVPGPAELYTMVLETRSGDVSAPDNAEGPNLVRIKSLSGDIDVNIAG